MRRGEGEAKTAGWVFRLKEKLESKPSPAREEEIYLQDLVAKDSSLEARFSATFNKS